MDITMIFFSVVGFYFLAQKVLSSIFSSVRVRTALYIKSEEELLGLDRLLDSLVSERNITSYKNVIVVFSDTLNIDENIIDILSLYGISEYAIVNKI